MRLALLVASVALVLGSGEIQAQQTADQPPRAETAVQPSDTNLATLGVGDGTRAARNESTTSWILGSYVAGLTTGPIGTGLAWFLADNSKARIETARALMLSAEGGPAYLQAYEQAYAETLRARRKRSALIGGGLGTATLGAGLFALWLNYYYY